jgi:GNAT superfamily N-acetyltransferase
MTKVLTVAYMDKLQRQALDDVSFYPRVALERGLAAGDVTWCEENGEPAGYLWHGPARAGRPLVIYQAVVDYDARRRSLGAGMVATVTDLARAAFCTGVRLRCASSSDSNEFWRVLGFRCIGVARGGIRRNRDINVWWSETQPTLLWVPDVEPSTVAISTAAYRAANGAMPSRYDRRGQSLRRTA